MTTRELSEKTPVPLKWLLAAAVAAFAAGGGYALVQSRLAAVEARVGRAEVRLDRVDEAVIALREIAAELKGRVK